MKRGTSVTGYWAIFPLTSEEPKRFPDRDGAVAYWPSKYVHFKLVIRVSYNPMTNEWRRDEFEKIDPPEKQAAS